jgi:hypothetical protein
MAGASFSGPLFDGRAEAEIREGVAAARHAIAKRGAELAAASFNTSIRDNRGRFISSITITEESRTYSSGGTHTYELHVDVPRDCEVVTTEQAAYGPWLEGTGSRNETTRFKGYHGFRMAAQELDRMAQVVTEQAIAPYVERCN